MAFHLRRTRDGEGESGGSSEAIEWNEDLTYKGVKGYYPEIGCSMKVGSVTARSYSNRDWWMTTPITEIVSETDDEIKFKTQNSSYTLKK